MAACDIGARALHIGHVAWFKRSRARLDRAAPTTEQDRLEQLALHSLIAVEQRHVEVLAQCFDALHARIFECRQRRLATATSNRSYRECDREHSQPPWPPRHDFAPFASFVSGGRDARSIARTAPSPFSSDASLQNGTVQRGSQEPWRRMIPPRANATVSGMTKTELHELVDSLPDESLPAGAILLRRAQDPVIAKLGAAFHR